MNLSIFEDKTSKLISLNSIKSTKFIKDFFLFSKEPVTVVHGKCEKLI